MKKIFLILAVLCMTAFWSCDDFLLEDGSGDSATEPETPVNPIPDDMEEAFPDPIFRACVIENFDTDGDGKISQEEASEVIGIDVSNKYLTPEGGYARGDKDIASLEGVQYFTNLIVLYCDYNRLTGLDVSKNKALWALSCSHNSLTSLDLSKNTKLAILQCYSNQLTSLDVSKNTALEQLYCSANQFTDLDLSNNTALTSLQCHDNQLTTLDVSKTDLGNSLESYPFKCAPMPTLKTLTLKRGWSINGITPKRNTSYIPEQTEIVFAD